MASNVFCLYHDTGTDSGGTRDVSDLSSGFQPMVALSSDATTSAADLTGTTVSEHPLPAKSRSRTQPLEEDDDSEEEEEEEGARWVTSQEQNACAN
jgi:hypothetical protein